MKLVKISTKFKETFCIYFRWQKGSRCFGNINKNLTKTQRNYKLCSEEMWEINVFLPSLFSHTDRSAPTYNTETFHRHSIERNIPKRMRDNGDEISSAIMRQIKPFNFLHAQFLEIGSFFSNSKGRFFFSPFLRILFRFDKKEMSNVCLQCVNHFQDGIWKLNGKS